MKARSFKTEAAARKAAIRAIDRGDPYTRAILQREDGSFTHMRGNVYTLADLERALPVKLVGEVIVLQ